MGGRRLCLAPGLLRPGLPPAQVTGAEAAPAPGSLLLRGTLLAHPWPASHPQVPFLLGVSGVVWAPLGRFWREARRDPLLPNMTVSPQDHTGTNKSERENQRDQWPHSPLIHSVWQPGLRGGKPVQGMGRGAQVVHSPVWVSHAGCGVEALPTPPPGGAAPGDRAAGTQPS